MLYIFKFDRVITAEKTAAFALCIKIPTRYVGVASEKLFSSICDATNTALAKKTYHAANM